MRQKQSITSIPARPFSRRLPPEMAAIALAVLLMMLWAMTGHPHPRSDSAEYWHEAFRPQDYVKGGPLGFLLWPLAHAGVPPWSAATILNGAAWIACVWSLHPDRVETTRMRWLRAGVLLCLGLPFIGMGPLVNSDLPSVAAFVVALRLWTLQVKRNAKFHLFGRGTVAVVLLLALALSFRPAVLIASVGMLPIWWALWLLTRRSAARQSGRVPVTRLLSATSLIVVVAALLATGVETGMRSVSTRHDLLARHSRTTLYTGLLDTEDCGYWSREGQRMANSDLSLPFATAARRRLASNSAADYAVLYRCKLQAIVLHSHSFAISELAARSTLNHPGAPATSLLETRILPALNVLESLCGALLQLAGVVLIFFLARRWESSGRSELLVPLSLVIAVYGLHAILETQPRYYLPAWAGAWVIGLAFAPWSRTEANADSVA